MTHSFPRNVVAASGTLAVVRFDLDTTAGVVSLAADAAGTETVALGHAKFIAPHVTAWTIEVEADDGIDLAEERAFQREIDAGSFVCEAT